MSNGLPSTSELAKHLSAIIGSKVVCTEAKSPLQWNDPKSVAGGVYKNQKGDYVAGFISDINFTAFSGAALTLTPLPVAEYMIRTSTLEAHIVDGYSEVMNIVAGLLNQLSATHVAVAESWSVRKKASPKAKQALTQPKVFMTYDVKIDGYGVGLVTLCRS